MFFPSEEAKKQYIIELSDRFLACGMNDAETRKSVRMRIPSEIEVGIREGETSTTAVFNIVTRCTEFPDGVEQLAFALRQVIKGTKLLDQLDVLVRKKSRMPISYVQRRELLDYMSYTSEIAWSEGVLRKAYQRSVPEDWPFLNVFKMTDVSELLALMIENLTTAGHLKTTYPVLEFVERLAVYAQSKGVESERDVLRRWVDWRASELKLADNFVGQMRVRIEQEDFLRIEKVPYLLVMLDTSSAEAEVNTPVENRLYSVQAWLVDEQGEYLTEQISVEDAPRKLEEVPQLLGFLLQQYSYSGSLVATMKDLVVEFIVPDELLSYSFASWQVQVEDYPFELGVWYKVVVRSIRRTKNQLRLLWSAWNDKWKRLQGALNSECPPAQFACICTSEGCQVRHNSSCSMLFCSRKECYDHKRLQAVLSSPSIVYLALAHADSPTSTPPMKDNNHVFRTIIQAGMPIVLWPGKQINNAEVLTPLLSYNALGSLPDEVRNWRKNVIIEGEEALMERRLSLLWDDPSRLPPPAKDVLYSAPTRNR